MLRQSSSRNQRSKGVKVKHVLQICLLVAICFWLIFQIKHSHDKRKQFHDHENALKISENESNNVEILKLGRKDLNPRKEEKVIDIEQHEEEEELEEEENKKHEFEFEEQEHEEEEITNEDKEDEERGVGDDEIDELDQEKPDREDDEKEERQTEIDGQDGNTRGAREEHYKADDASSEVTHDHTDAINTEIEKITTENKIQNNVTEKISDQIGNNTVFVNSEDVSVNNSTIIKEFTYEPEVITNLTELNTEKPGPSLLNITENITNSTQAQNLTVQDPIIEDISKFNSNTTVTVLSFNGTDDSNPKSEPLITKTENGAPTEEPETTYEEKTINENGDLVQHDDSILQEEKQNRIDLDTLPEIRTDWTGSKDSAAE